MVTGYEYVFDNIYQARDYIIDNERKALSADVLRKAPPPCIPRNPRFSTSFESAKETPIPVDSIDYPLNSYFNAAPDHAFIMTRLQSGRFVLKPNLAHRKYLFRGEPEFHNPCKPNLFRNPKKKYFLDWMIHGDEMALLILSHPLVQLLDLGVYLSGRHIRFEMNLHGLIQHYYNKTDLLDLTSDIDVAMFFATQNYDWKTDSYSPIIDRNHEPGVLYYYDIDFNRDFQRQQDGELLSTIGLQVFPRSGRQSGFLYQCSIDKNFNDLPQLRAFRFKHDAQVAQEIYEKMNGGEKLFPYDILQSHWRNFNRDKDKVSEAAVRFNHTRNQNETMSSLISRLKNEYQIDVDNYKPVLTGEELGEYYESMKDGTLWEEFCSRIVIPGDIDGRMMNDLKNVPNKSEYQWAFAGNDSYELNYDDGYLLKKYKHILKS